MLPCAKPSPLCGGGCPAEPGGRGGDASGNVATVVTGAPWISVALPLSRLAPLATLPRRGGRVLARRSPHRPLQRLRSNSENSFSEPWTWARRSLRSAPERQRP